MTKAAGGVTTVFHYDLGGNLIAETDGDGSTLAEYVYAGTSLASLPLAKIEGAEVYAYHADHLGVPMRMTDGAGAVVWEAGYSSFGLASVSGGIVSNLRLPGQYFDAETGLHYNWHRYYAPELGRYLQPDPLGLAGGTNLYAYVSNNPLGSIDPTGLIDLKIPGGIGDLAVHANPGPGAAARGQAEHLPAHVHLGDRSGPRVDTTNFQPLKPRDEQLLTPRQRKFCRELSEENRNLIRVRQGLVYKYGKYLPVAGGIGSDTMTRHCTDDPIDCFEVLDALKNP